VVLGLDNREDAERVFDLTGDLARQQLLQLQDAAYAWRDDRGKVRIQQAINLTGAGAASGALWGTLIGLIFLNPLAGLAVGAATGGVAGKLTDVGINDDMIKQIGQQLQQGKAAVFILARSATVDKVIEALKPYSPTIIQTNLTKDREEELVRRCNRDARRTSRPTRQGLVVMAEQVTHVRDYAIAALRGQVMAVRPA
jgi:uncharacterized membrane protein